MKKIFLVVLALLLALPAVSYAGSATSRWDLTIGGFVKFDGGYESQAVGSDYMFAVPGSIPGNANLADDYGSSFMASGETRLSFQVKGPEAWGAKTSALVEGDFRQGGAYEGFRLRHAYMKFDWPNTSLTIGQTTGPWLQMATYNVLGISEAGMGRNGRYPLIIGKTNLGKNWFVSYGIVSAAASSTVSEPRASKGIPTAANSSRIFEYPYADVQLGFKSDACGKIGAEQLTFILGGMAGVDKTVKRNTTTGKSGDDDSNSFGLAFKAYVPIIPGKETGKAGALAVTGVAFYAQGSASEKYPTDTFDAYIRRASIDSTGLDFEAINPLTTGGWAGVTYYITDKVFVNGFYGTQQWKLSNAVKRDTTYLNSSYPRTFQHYIVNVMYDVNPAIRLGAEFAHITTGYARTQAAGGGGASGKQNVGRVAAWYFF